MLGCSSIMNLLRSGSTFLSDKELDHSLKVYSQDRYFFEVEGVLEFDFLNARLVEPQDYFRDQVQGSLTIF